MLREGRGCGIGQPKIDDFEKRKMTQPKCRRRKFTGGWGLVLAGVLFHGGGRE